MTRLICGLNEPPVPMDIYKAVMIAEGNEAAKDDAEYIEAWQRLHDTGTVYKLQGWFGRQAQRMIDAGEITR